MLKFVEDTEDGVAIPITQGLGHIPFNRLSDVAVRASLGSEWGERQRAKMYALGMSGSPGLQVVAQSTKGPARQRSAARWWIAHGAAVTQ